MPEIDDQSAVVAAGRRRPSSALGLVFGPLSFAIGWAALGASIQGFSPRRMAISELAAVDSSRRWAMFAVFVLYGAAMLIGSAALRNAGARAASVAAVVNGFSVWGVAAFPVHGSERGDAIHGGFALLGYLSIAAIPLLAAGPLARGGHRGAAVASVVAGLVCAASLAGANGNDQTGMFQRLGTTTGNIWTVTAGLVLLALRRSTPEGRSVSE